MPSSARYCALGVLPPSGFDVKVSTSIIDLTKASKVYNRFKRATACFNGRLIDQKMNWPGKILEASPNSSLHEDAYLGIRIYNTDNNGSWYSLFTFSIVEFRSSAGPAWAVPPYSRSTEPCSPNTYMNPSDGLMLLRVGNGVLQKTDAKSSLIFTGVIY